MEKAEREAVEKVVIVEARIIEITSVHSDVLKRREREAEEACKRLQAKLEQKSKEADLYLKQVDAKTRELKDTVVKMQHGEEIREKQFQADVEDLKAKFKAKLDLKDKDMAAQEGRRLRELEQLAKELEVSKKQALEKLRDDYETKLFKANEATVEAIELAIAAIVLEKEALLVEKVTFIEKIKEMELQMGMFASKEIRAEDFLAKQNEKLKKEVARAQQDSDDRAFKLKQEIEYADAQKKRAVEETQKSCEKRLTMKDAELATVAKELSVKQQDLKRSLAEVQRNMNQQLKMREDELLVARREIDRLQKALSEVDIEIDIVEVDVEVDRVEIIEEKITVRG